jgi:HEAT repeat protein
MTKSVVATLAFSLIILTGCQSEPDPEDINSWVRAGKYNKINDLVGNTEIKEALRLNALATLVEYGQRTRLQSALEAVPDRENIFPKFQESMTAMLKNSDLKLQIEGKNALLALRRYLTDEEQEQMLGVVAAWGFAGLTDKTPRDILIKVLQEREVAGDLSGMKRHGVKVAAWLVRYGINTESLVPYLQEAKDPNDQAAIVKAAKKLFAMKNIKPVWGLVEAVKNFPIPDTLEFLVDLYLSDFNDTLRDACFFAIQDLVFDKVGGKSVSNTPKKRARVLAALKRLMESHSTTDRWDASDMMLHVGGVEELSSILGGFKYDGRAYVRRDQDGRQENPDDVIVRMCEGRLAAKKDLVRPVLEGFLKTGNEAQKSIVILCLKSLAQPVSIPKLKALAKDETSLEKFFFSGEDRKKRAKAIEKRKIKVLTVGLLALNAIDGINVHGEIARAVQDKKMTKEEAMLRTKAVNSVFFVSGKQFRPAVEQAYRSKKEKL